MELPTPNNGEETPEQDPPNLPKSPNYPYEFDSNCSTPYVSAPSSPSRNNNPNHSYFFSAPSSPIHFLATSVSSSFEFNGSGSTQSMISADEIFFNGQIRPMKLSSHLKNPQRLAPLLNIHEEDEEQELNENNDKEVYPRGRELRSRSVHRRARSLSPLRNPRFQWQDEEEELEEAEKKDIEVEDTKESEETAVTSASSSRSSSSSSSSRHSKRWIFLKDLLYRSKSEGRASERADVKEKDKFWLSSAFKNNKEAKQTSQNNKSNGSRKSSNGVGKRLQSAHERHYTANRAQAEEMRKRTFLPYRQGLLGCLGFNSRSYGAVSGFARVINPVSSR